MQSRQKKCIIIQWSNDETVIKSNQQFTSFVLQLYTANR